MGIKVNNVNGTSDKYCKCGSWLDHWKKYSRQTTNHCSEVAHEEAQGRCARAEGFRHGCQLVHRAAVYVAQQGNRKEPNAGRQHHSGRGECEPDLRIGGVTRVAHTGS